MNTTLRYFIGIMSLCFVLSSCAKNTPGSCMPTPYAPFYGNYNIYTNQIGVVVRHLHQASDDVVLKKTPDEKFLIWSSRHDSAIRTWEIGSRNIATIKDQQYMPYIISEDGTKLISSSQNHQINVWDIQAGKNLGPLSSGLRRHRTFIDWFAISKDGTIAASGDERRKIIVWDLVKKKRIAVLRLPKHPHSLRFDLNARGNNLIIYDRDTITLWDVHRQKTIRIFKNVKSYGLLKKQDAFYILNNRKDRHYSDLSIWDAANIKEKYRFKDITQNNGWFTVNQTAEQILIAQPQDDDSTKYTFIDMETGAPIFAHSMKLPRLHYRTFQGDLMAGTMYDEPSRIGVWNIRTGKKISSFENAEANHSTTIFFSEDGNSLWTNQHNWGEVSLSHIYTGEKLFTDHTGWMRHGQMIPIEERNLYAFSGSGKMIEFFQLNTLKYKGSLNIPVDNEVCFVAADGRYTGTEKAIDNVYWAYGGRSNDQWDTSWFDIWPYDGRAHPIYSAYSYIPIRRIDSIYRHNSIDKILLNITEDNGFHGPSIRDRLVGQVAETQFENGVVIVAFGRNISSKGILEKDKFIILINGKPVELYATVDRSDHWDYYMHHCRLTDNDKLSSIKPGMPVFSAE